MSDGLEELDLGAELAWDPVRIVQPGPWTGHMPFAFWVVKALRPTTLVELGTHSGNSYFAFCQAMNAYCQSGRAFAVDTWQGDEHAGHYGEDVFADVAAFNAAHFRQFSTLIRSTFDEARRYFPDGTPGGGIDLLHIDGLHSHEAVQHDFETWRPALSSRAVVLFHDINVRERDFGVWRLWEELRSRYPGFAFDHSNGLGVLGVGPDQAPALHALFNLPLPAATAFRRRIAARGEAFERQAELLAVRAGMAAKDAQIADLTNQVGLAVHAQIAAKDAQIADLTSRAELALHTKITAKDAQIADLTGQVGAIAAAAGAVRTELAWTNGLLDVQRDITAAKEAEIAFIRNTAAARAAAIRQRDRLIDVRDHLAMTLATNLQNQRHDYETRLLQTQGAANAAMEAATARLEEQRATHAATYAALQAQVQAEVHIRVQAELQAEVAAVTARYINSTSWKLTRPLRVAVRLLKERRLRPVPLEPSMLAPPVSVPAPPMSVPEQVPPEAISAEAPIAGHEKAAMRTMLSSQLDAFLSTNATLRLPRVERPEVSIVLVLYNQAELTFGCLRSIVETIPTNSPGVEVVILDNGSSDRTSALLDRIEGATVIRSEINLHFLKGVNRAAKSARGRTLLLLNNDAQLLPEAVASALRTLDSGPDIGAVGGRLIMPDGTLQEAGSILWRNGAASGYGRGQDPNGPDFMFQRDVDYCSGAFLLTPMAVWTELGGFDERYAPAYYEETDYCLRLWESGRRVVFDPDVAVIHYEFGSSSSSAEALALQQANHRIFTESHRGWLDGQLPLDPANVIAARTARSDRPRVLVIDDRVPKPELGTGYPRANRLLHELVEAGADVALFPIHRHPETWHGVRHALDKRIEVLIAADGTQLRAYLEARRNHFDAIIVCRPPNMAVFENAIGSDRDLIGKARVIYDAEALFVTRNLQRRLAEGRPAEDLERHDMIAAEVSLTRLADTVISVSAAEQETLETYGAGDVRILAHALSDEPLPTGYEARDRIVFLGAIQSEDAPNADAVRWFAESILPGVRRRLGEATRLTVVGMNKAQSVEALDGSALDLRGMVEDLRGALSDARVMVVPSRIGAGIPHKVHQAAAMGIPMVVTGLIADQLGWKDGHEVLVADDAAAFAEAIARLYDDRNLWERVRGTALEQVQRETRPEAFRDAVRGLVADMPIVRRLPEHAKPARSAVKPKIPEEPGTSRPAREDYSLALPFDFASLSGPAPRVAVVCHLFHLEVGAELRAHLNHLPGPTNLFLSTDSEEKAKAIHLTFADWGKGSVTVRVMPNRGRDIAPKLIGLSEAHDGHDLVLHLHSKRSDHATFLAPWRSFLYETLMGSPAVVASILDAFARLPKLGMLAPQHYESVRRWIGWNGNYDAARDLASRMGVALSPIRALDFPSGSMFWARPAALRPLLDLNLSFEDFPAEDAQLDHTLAHAIERLYFFSCERSGHTWLKVSRPEFFHEGGTIVRARTPRDLDRFVGEHGVMLTGPMTLPVSSEPAPLITRIPPGLSRRLATRDF